MRALAATRVEMRDTPSLRSRGGTGSTVRSPVTVRGRTAESGCSGVRVC